ncbi:MAG: glutamate synthase [candidate division KSB1 bacterium]|nr:glutamate synthase [candidate division KSB1 bacterium]MDZ7304133.1 glutamate synthase [candidate division KSB1 bacterium]MDZ7314089.1 glutamate synthase [candidate division KSB1 bacterium]
MAELHPLPFTHLVRRMFREFEKQRKIFDLPAQKFYRSNGGPDLSVEFCGMKAGTPVGPAAGPQTQMAQNLVLSWLGGGRILELKTIQILDQLNISRPCIDMKNVGYNVEWSQELRLEQSLREYVAGHMLIEMLIAANVLEQNDPLDKTETIFDVSVGYDLKGIQSQLVRDWLNAIKEATAIVEELRQQIPAEFSHYRDFPFKTQIAKSLTLSTFHGCPAQEIESIVHFLLTEMDYHVVIKMNPPMLGKEKLEYLLYDRLGYHDVEVNPKVYQVNITFDEAVQVVRRLKSTADRLGKTVGVKFTNTLEVINKGKFFPDEIMYLSGPPLHVLAMALVEDWRRVCGTTIPISFSAGIDQHNFPDAVAAGLVPITTCTDLLKPGGYGRLHKYLLNLENKMSTVGAASVSDYILKWNGETNDPDAAIIANTSKAMAKVLSDPRYTHDKNKSVPRKIDSSLTLFDCLNCDKCIPVCPNDANFYYELQPLEVQYAKYCIGLKGDVEEIPGGVLRIEKSHQIANYADFCNECGNCDVFCPELGGPYIEKPRFFGSRESWEKLEGQNGFWVEEREGAIVLHGWIEDRIYVLRVDRTHPHAHFLDEALVVHLEWPGLEVIRVENCEPESVGHVLDMKVCYQMAALLRGVMDGKMINYINVMHSIIPWTN